MHSEQNSVLFGVEQKPGRALTLALALQHVLILLMGIELIPLMLAQIHDMSELELDSLTFTTMLAAATATLLQVFRFGKFGLGYTMFFGASGAYLACSHSAVNMGGVALLAGMSVLSAPVQVLYSYFFRYFRNIITPMVGGVVIMLAMVGLLKDSASLWAGIHDEGDAIYAESIMLRLLIGVLTITVLIAVEWFGGKRWRPWSLVIGVCVGCLASWGMGLFHFQPVLSARWFGAPLLVAPDFHVLATPNHVTLLFTFMLSSLVTSVKYTGDAMALQQVSSTRSSERTRSKSKVDYDAVQGGLYSGALGSIISGLSGGMPITSHSANISFVQVSGVASRRVGIWGAAMLAVMAFCPKVTHLMSSLPSPVLGAVGVALVVHLFTTGLFLAMSDDLSYQKGLIIGFALSAGLIVQSGVFPSAIFPSYLQPLTENGFAIGGLTAIILSAMSRVFVDRRTACKVKMDDESLVKLKSWLGRKTVTLGLPSIEAYRLELACEEVFLHLRKEFEIQGLDAPVVFKLWRGDERIIVEAVAGAKVSDMDSTEIRTPLETQLKTVEKMTEKEMNRLGLHLLAKVASDVTHSRISGYEFISFHIPAA